MAGVEQPRGRPAPLAATRSQTALQPCTHYGTSEGTTKYYIMSSNLFASDSATNIEGHKIKVTCEKKAMNFSDTIIIKYR
jgi:hypothetical protein